jgi:hypothetical protein
MIFEISRAVADRLKDHPVAVYYGRERFERNIHTRNRVEIRELGGDSWEPAPTTRSGPEPILWRNWVAVEVLIDVASSKGGASEADHRRACRAIVEAFANALLIVTQARKQPIRNQQMTGGFVDDPETPKPSAARYALTFSIGKPVTHLSAATVTGLLHTGSPVIDGEVVCPTADEEP